jgi:hypothetical protein
MNRKPLEKELLYENSLRIYNTKISNRKGRSLCALRPCFSSELLVEVCSTTL